MAICCEVVHHKVSFSPPEASESLASELMYSDVCRVGDGENCSAPAPEEGRTGGRKPFFVPGPSQGQVVPVMLESHESRVSAQSEASGNGERLGGGRQGKKAPGKKSGLH